MKIAHFLIVTPKLPGAWDWQGYVSLAKLYTARVRAGGQGQTGMDSMAVSAAENHREQFLVLRGQ